MVNAENPSSTAIIIPDPVIGGDDDLFLELNSLKNSLAAKNQPLIPAIITIFGDFKKQIVADLNSKLQESVDSIKNECLSACKAKDGKIKDLQNLNHDLKKQITKLEDKLDAAEAYERKDTIVISGAIPGLSADKDTNQVVTDLIKQKLKGFPLDPKDISVSHGLPGKRPNSAGVTHPPNIIVKLVRRDMKRALIMASKKQNKDSANRIFINESLTPKRRVVFQSLLKMKKGTATVRGVTTIDGDVYAFTPAAADQSGAVVGRNGQPKDIRHRINTIEELRKFCGDNVQKPLENFLASWPAVR